MFCGKEQVFGIMKMKKIGVSLISLLRLTVFALCIWLAVECRVQAAGTVLENDKFKLELLNNYSEVQLTDKTTKEVWSSSMNDPAFAIDKVSKKWRTKMQSLFTLNVTNLKRGVGNVSNFDLLGCAYTAEPYDTDYGIGVKYDLPEAGVKVCIEFALTEDGFSVRVPSEKLEEYDAFSAVSLDLMPFFAAAADDQEGYLFYPDGSGAILEYSDPSHVGESPVSYNVYGDIVNNENLKGRFEQEEALTLLPVFGINYGSKGAVAYVTRGEETTRFTVNPSTKIIKASYVYPTVIFRRGFDDPRVKGEAVKKYDDEQLKTDYEIHYEILPEGKAGYADMAVAYREYLLDSGLLKDSGDDGMTLSLDIFMGIKEEGLIFDTFRSVTNFAQAQEILEDLKVSVDTALEVSLLGWTKSGYGTQPQYFPVNSSLGGKKGLNSLAKYASENGISLSLAADFLTADAEQSGYSQNTDIVFLGNYQVLTDRRNSVRIISPDTALKNFQKFMKKAKAYDIAGLKLENLGDMLYYNYNSRSTMLATQCRANWIQMLSDTKETFGSVTSEGGNLYVLSLADKVTDIPTEDIGYQMTTREVPFYQIVVHGSVKYTGEALNLSSDARRLRLKWIEYGYTPYFELTYESAEKLINTDYNELFTSTYADWRDDVLATCEELKPVWNATMGAKIISHEEVAENVFCTGYDNGVRVYVNYNEQAVSIEGVKLEALSWEVSR